MDQLYIGIENIAQTYIDTDSQKLKKVKTNYYLSDLKSNQIATMG